jgi:hypothetical protein
VKKDEDYSSMENLDTKKKTTGKAGKSGKMPVPFKAPARTVKGIGKLGQFEGGLSPSVVAPKYGPNGGRLTGQILGREGKRTK